ncbi:MAG: hypothetical protein NTW29_16840 [Bacteroidetes bacterium]|nr:hypothetical protein [Bacteroidota bacterium]
MATTLKGRCIYVHKLSRILTLEGTPANIAAKAKKAKLSSIWIKVAEGKSRNANITGTMKDKFIQLRDALKAQNITIWGWHVPRCFKPGDDVVEANLVATICSELQLEGILVDAESGTEYFRGDANAASGYMTTLRNALDAQGKGLAISSHDIPSNMPTFPFASFAFKATVNAPQVYYGGSPSVKNRLERSMNDPKNKALKIPYVPVGAGWVGTAGGCRTNAACAQKALEFMALVKQNKFPGYSFWVWDVAPKELWDVFFNNPV